MDVRRIETKRTMFNVALARVTGLYRILDPESAKLGDHNVYGLINVVLALYTFLVSAVLFVNGVRFWTDYTGQRTETVLAVVEAFSYVFSCRKIVVVVYRSSDILGCLSIARFDFTSLGRRHTRLLESWRNRPVELTDLYAYTSYVSAALYVLCPLCFGHESSTVTAVDGSSDRYRVNVLNLYTFFAAETYNGYFYAMYLMEATCLSLFVYFFVVFDTLLADLCSSLVCQLKIINAALKRFRLEPIARHRNPNNVGEEIEPKTIDDQCTTYNDLKTIIKDHQAVIKKLETLLSIFGDIILTQIVISSSTLVVMWYTIIKKYTDENVQTDFGATIIIVKLIIACPVLLFQLFMACYLFQFIFNEKESIIFSLYSSNWTEMDMKCKKLIVLTMKMNNANQKKLKFSRLRVVNLEMFLGTVRIGYSVLSVLLKT